MEEITEFLDLVSNQLIYLPEKQWNFADHKKLSISYGNPLLLPVIGKNIIHSRPIAKTSSGSAFILINLKLFNKLLAFPSKLK